jgi:hypothetical protein
MASQLANDGVASNESPQLRGYACPICNTVLPICSSANPTVSAIWVCENCNHVLNGTIVPALANQFGRHVRLVPEVFECGESESIPTALRELVNEFLIRRRMRQEGHERRKNQRVLCNLDAVFVGLDDQWMPCRPPVPAVVIDLAAHGIGVMTAKCLNDDRFAIQLECQAGSVQVIGRRAWSNLIGDSFQNTGIEFLARLGQSTVTTDGLVS